MKVLIVTANNGFPYVEVCMSSIHNNNFSVYFTLPALKKRVLIIFFVVVVISLFPFVHWYGEEQSIKGNLQNVITKRNKIDTILTQQSGAYPAKRIGSS